LPTEGHTIKYRPRVIAYTEAFEEKKDALIRNKQLKHQIAGQQFGPL
jgi:predicted GIY-YIG superfamily endonuclease